jgi:serine/threonine protein kinase
MSITLVCPGCRSKLKAPDKLAGRKAKCPTCGQPIPVPAGEPQAARTGGSGARSVAPASQAREIPHSEIPTVPPDVASPVAQPTQSFPAANKELYDFLAPPQAPDEIGRLGPYRVLRILGHGGMGVVYQAEDPQLKRLVALKVMLPALAASESSRQRFLLEARSAAAIEHDHIVAIYQVGEDRGVPFLAMPFLRGESLQDRLQREGKVPLAEVLRIGRETAEGLAAAHARGLMHRDIKPANIWLEEGRGRVKIVDFGLARAVGGEAGLTQSGMIVGTPQYMAPEQTGGQPIDCRCDLFSLGCVLYRLSTGELPFQGPTVLAVLAALATVQPKPLTELNPDLPPAFVALVMQLLAKNPVDRPASAQAVAEALADLEREHGITLAGSGPVPPVRRSEGAMASDPTLAAPPPRRAGGSSATMPERTPSAVPPPKRRRGVLAAVCVLAVLGAGAGAAVWFDPLGRLRPTQPTTVAGAAPKAEPSIPEDEEKSPATDVAPKGNPVGKKKGPPRGKGGSPSKGEAPPQKVEPSPSLSPAPVDRLTRDLHVPLALREKAPPEVVAVVNPKLIRDNEHGGACAVAFSPDGKTLAIGTFNGPIQLWDVASWSAGKRLVGPTSRSCGLQFSPDGHKLASACRYGDHTVRLWDVERGTPQVLFGGKQGDACCLAFFPAGQTTVAVGHAGGPNPGVRLLDWSKGRGVPRPGLRQSAGPVYSLAVSPDGAHLAAGMPEAGVRLWDLKTGETRTLEGSNRPAHALAFSPDGKQLAAAYPFTTKVRLWNVTSGVGRWLEGGHKRQVNSVAFSPDGTTLATESLDGTVRLWSPRTGAEARPAIQVIGELKSEHEDRENRQIVFGPDGRHLAVANGGVRILRLAAR